ncbi:DUF1376 domain-containing protein [Methylosinus sp. Ce-a6]|uniref:DUF1376 domain-containing protein n=1 Tax=Methylosinus sp. Ce-a6 TaxID=2172005 RepID=UPI001358CABF|nr:DUF1376 domain-containing protein [Methylosinus sp. Ce-a6]
MVNALPEPLLPPFVDLRDFRFMPLIIEQLRRSKQWLIAKRRPEVGFYSLNLWAASWHELPAGSMEDDDDVLADAAMCSPERWPSVRDDALRGWIKCSDGRLYHPTVCAEAANAWNDKAHHRWRKECERVKKENSRRKEKGLPPLELPGEPMALSPSRAADMAKTVAGQPRDTSRTMAECPRDNAALSVGQDSDVTTTSREVSWNKRRMSDGQGGFVIETGKGNPTEIALKGQGQCKGQGQTDDPPAQRPVPRAPAESDRPADERPPDPGARLTKSELDRVEWACRAALGDAAPQDQVIGPMVEIVRKSGQERVSLCLASEARRPREKPIRTWKIWARIVAESLTEGPSRTASADSAGPSERMFRIGWLDVEWPERAARANLARWEEAGFWADAWGPIPPQSRRLREIAAELGITITRAEKPNAPCRPPKRDDAEAEDDAA